MDDSSSLDWLTRWYERQCDGDWEHSYGVSIETLDNPGWSLKIDLSGTSDDGRTMDRVASDLEHETEWWTCWTDGNVFRGACGPRHLTDLIEAFRDWTESRS
jgi:hypothetical protein